MFSLAKSGVCLRAVSTGKALWEIFMTTFHKGEGCVFPTQKSPEISYLLSETQHSILNRTENFQNVSFRQEVYTQVKIRVYAQKGYHKSSFVNRTAARRIPSSTEKGLLYSESSCIFGILTPGGGQSYKMAAWRGGANHKCQE